LGANTKHELHELESILRKMSSEKLLEQGITLLDATRVDVRGVVVAGKDCTVDVNVIFEGKVTLGETLPSNQTLFYKTFLLETTPLLNLLVISHLRQ
jgi:bifunctional N-acetylglucosamine-1-phosphate-uridyltransferase/glucosamine-1-phosphate-acetyltransferase GlmU-like protein